MTAPDRIFAAPCPLEEEWNTGDWNVSRFIDGDVEYVRADLARELLNDLLVLISESDGVAGLHQNGDLAPWSELVSGGRFDEWIASLDTLAKALPQPPEEEKQ